MKKQTFFNQTRKFKTNSINYKFLFLLGEIPSKNGKLPFLHSILSLHAWIYTELWSINRIILQYEFKYRSLFYGFWITSIVELNNERFFIFKQRYRMIFVVVVFFQINNILTLIVSIFSRELHTQMKTNHDIRSYETIYSLQPIYDAI